MHKVIESNLNANDLKFGIVVSRFNDFITSRLLEGAIDCLKRHGAAIEEVEISWVPGAFEIPLIAKKMSNSKKFDAVICLGAVIRGSTSHYDHVCNEVSKGVQKISNDTEIPNIFGLVTTDTIEQAVERAGSKAGNKGWEAALSAIEMGNLIKIINSKLY